MKGKWNLIASIFQLVIGVLGVISFLILGIGGEDMTPWLITLVVASAISMLGIFGIVEYKKNK